MSQKEINKIKQEVKEKALAKIRNRWFKEYRERKNAKTVCEKFGISRSKFYYWKNRLDLKSRGKGTGLSREVRLISLSRTPKTQPQKRNPKNATPPACKRSLSVPQATSTPSRYEDFAKSRTAGAQN